jgi:hypothetical protein
VIADRAGSIANIAVNKCAVIPQTAVAVLATKFCPLGCASQRCFNDWLLRDCVSAISHFYFVGFFMPLDATMPDNVPVKNTTMVDMMSIKLASLGDCSIGWLTNVRL